MCKNYLDDWFGGTKANQQLAQSQAQATQLQQKLASDNAAREGRIRSGKASIDDAFSRYGDAYYDQYRQDYLSAQNPAIDYQYERANDKLAAALAGRGVERSTIAGNAFGDTAAGYAGARAKAANDAFGAANALRERVENAKSQLYGINTGASDPSQIASQAAASSTALTPLPATSQVGDIFGAALSPFANAVKADTNSIYGGKIRKFFEGGLPTGSGSGVVVG